MRVARRAAAILSLCTVLGCSCAAPWDRKKSAEPSTREALLKAQGGVNAVDTEPVEAQSPPDAQQTAEPQQPPKAKRWQRIKPASPSAQLFEVALATLCALYVVNYVLGNGDNKRIATAFSALLQPLYSEEFALAGPLTKLAPDTFVYYASGRKGCRSMSVTLSLRSRQDLPAVLLRSGQQDTVTVEVVLNADESDPIVLAIVRQSQLKTTLNQFTDLRELTAKRAVADLSRKLLCLGESSESVSSIITPAVVDAVSTAQGSACLDYIYLTDQNEGTVAGCSAVPKHVLRCLFTVPDTNDLQQLQSLMTVPLLIVDALSAYKMPAAAKTKAIERRDAAEQTRTVESHQARLQRMQNLKYEKIQKEKAEYALLTAEQKVKRDIKANKQALKQAKKGPKAKKL